jgi:ligand-binding sensor domain-containing protein
MKHHPRQLYPLILLLIFVASCNGQEKTIAAGQPRIVKTQGTNQYANVHCGLQDKAGNVWFGTTGEGVYRYDGKLFTQYTVKDGLSSNFIWCVTEDAAGNIWFGTADGISRYDGLKFTVIPFSAFDSSNTKLWFDRYGNPSEQNAIWDILQDKSGKFWFATTRGMYRYAGTSFARFTDNDGAINSTGDTIKKIEYILEDKAGNIWFGGRMTKGVFRFDGKSLTNDQSHGKNWLWPQLEDKAGNIWFSNWAGAYRYDGKAITKFNDKDSSIKTTTCIFEDRSGNLWFGGDHKDGPLCRYDGTSVTHFTTKDGLSNNSVWCIVEDRSGNLWFGTRGMGLCRYDGKSFTNFSE